MAWFAQDMCHSLVWLLAKMELHLSFHRPFCQRIVLILQLERQGHSSRLDGSLYCTFHQKCTPCLAWNLQSLLLETDARQSYYLHSSAGCHKQIPVCLHRNSSPALSHTTLAQTQVQCHWDICYHSRPGSLQREFFASQLRLDWQSLLAWTIATWNLWQAQTVWHQVLQVRSLLCRGTKLLSSYDVMNLEPF